MILFSGDSIVNGFPYRRTQSFPSIIERELGVTVYNEGRNGETAAQLSRYFLREVKRLKPDMVFIMTGSNDVMEVGVTAEGVAETILEMADGAAKLGAEVVLMTSIDNDPVLASQRWMRGVDYVRANNLLSEIGTILKDSEYTVIDTGTLYRECGEYTDGVHPTPAGYRFIADIIMNGNYI
ncbi:MAG: hypothetical protein KBS66_01210 [Eubacterium sp.]|nr:hypothetical protein [Candidatus Colimonas fimequi]